VIVRKLLPVATLLIVAAAGCTGQPAGRTDQTERTGPTSGPSTTTAAKPPSPPATQEQRKSPLPTTAAAAAERRADALASATRCGPAGTQTSFVELTWHPARSGGTQRVVYTPFADGYRTGRYELSSDLAPGAASLTLQQLSPGSAYTWLVLTKHGDAWDASATAQFMAPICVADQGRTN